MTSMLESAATDRVEDRTGRYCVIGAGASGLTAARNLLEYGFEVDVIERSADVGGTWNVECATNSAYRSLHMITSKPYIQFPDFPIPADYPTYLPQHYAQRYLRAYAEHFGVTAHIEFEAEVESVDRFDGGPEWMVRVRDGAGVAQRRYGGVVIANGHNWLPKYPRYPGTFDGLVLHSGEYKAPDVLRGKRVLVVGSGVSACDIAVESSQNAERTLLSVRRGNYFWPKFMFGMPADAFYESIMKLNLPRTVRRAFGYPFLRMNIAGNPVKYGLPRPEHKIFDEHFIINSTLLYHLGQGDIVVRPAITELCGDRVRFADGSEEEIDVVVYGTGFHKAEFPFIDRKHLNFGDGPIPRFHLRAFHPEYDNLFMIGYFQTSSGYWPIMHYQAQIMARYLYLLRTDPRRVAAFRDAKSAPMYGQQLNGGLRFYQSDRHLVQVEHYSFSKRLRKVVSRLAVDPPHRVTV
ncbi:flavin-containing monooxygenase [Nocardia sp. NPDC052566]|uniref:flavin-containing monooxygenase n=1 Tax=Nocardia sp. NPDC052566 TaxID=3364330 RepID=UPI0037C5AE4A